MYKVGIIGLGFIAVKYGSPDSQDPYCHVGGIRFSDKVQLVSVVDLSDDAVEGFRSGWGALFPNVHYYTDTAAMLKEEELDIVAICVRGPYHYKVAMEVIAANPKAIFLEKPPTCSLEEMDVIVAASADRHIPITASYSRHWAPKFLDFKSLFKVAKLEMCKKL